MGQKTNPTGFRLAVRRNWQSRWFATKKDFPKLFRQMGGSDGGNPNAEQPPLEPYTLADELRDQAMLAVGSIATSLSGLTPEVRWELVRHLDATRAPAIACGIKEPEPEPF